ncbi:MAG TPA: twin-arginine translocase subunit TatC [Anaerolineae bacterium]|nr:twin-arginine translocase subunit TatC [Anaerolineae bacterium]
MTEKEMSLLEHIIELRGRVFRAVVVWLVATVIATIFVESHIMPWLLRPLGSVAGVKIIVLSPAEGAITYFKIALVGGFSVALPYILFEIYGFIAPGLYKAERVTYLLGIPTAIVLFVIGAIFTVEVLLPPSLTALSGIFSKDVESQYSLQYYLSFFTMLVFWMGLIFQTPLVIYVIARLGAVTPQLLAKGRRIVWFLAVVAAAIVTPTPDPITMLLVTAPFIVLYEIGILLSHIGARQRARSGEAAEAANSE